MTPVRMETKEIHVLTNSIKLTGSSLADKNESSLSTERVPTCEPADQTDRAKQRYN